VLSFIHLLGHPDSIVAHSRRTPQPVINSTKLLCLSLCCLAYAVTFASVRLTLKCHLGCDTLCYLCCDICISCCITFVLVMHCHSCIVVPGRRRREGSTVRLSFSRHFGRPELGILLWDSPSLSLSSNWYRKIGLTAFCRRICKSAMTSVFCILTTLS